jgi:hypothetical protein
MKDSATKSFEQAYNCQAAALFCVFPAILQPSAYSLPTCRASSEVVLKGEIRSSRLMPLPLFFSANFSPWEGFLLPIFQSPASLCSNQRI